MQPDGSSVRIGDIWIEIRIQFTERGRGFEPEKIHIFGFKAFCVKFSQHGTSQHTVNVNERRSELPGICASVRNAKYRIDEFKPRVIIVMAGE
jgi:hypothetical protein